MKKLLFLALLVTTTAQAQFRRSSDSNAYPYTATLGSDYVFIIGRPGVTNYNYASSNLWAAITNIANGAATNAAYNATNNFVVPSFLGIKTNSVTLKNGATNIDFVAGANTSVTGSVSGASVTVGISSSGEANTASNLASNSTVKPIFSNKTGVDLQFRGVEAGSNTTMGITATAVIINANSLLTTNVVWVSKNGNDSTGIRGDMDHPFLTFQGALVVATNGDTVIVMPGTYGTTFNQVRFKNEVNWHFMEGANCDGTGGSRRFTDFYSGGAITSNVSGYGMFTNSVLEVNYGSRINFKCRVLSGLSSSGGAIFLTGNFPDSTNAQVTVEADLLTFDRWVVYAGYCGTNGSLTINRTRIDNRGATEPAIMLTSFSGGLILNDCVILSDVNSVGSISGSANARIYGNLTSNVTNTTDITWIVGATKYLVDTDVR